MTTGGGHSHEPEALSGGGREGVPGAVQGVRVAESGGGRRHNFDSFEGGCAAAEAERGEDGVRRGERERRVS